jgi:repressor LexA
MKPNDLKDIREELGLTQQQLAEALRTTRVSVARYEAGMRRIPGIVSVVLNQLRRKATVPMAGVVAAGSPIEPVPQSELVDIPLKGQGGIHERRRHLAGRYRGCA